MLIINVCVTMLVQSLVQISPPMKEELGHRQTYILTYAVVVTVRYWASSQALRSSCLKPAALAAIHSTLIPSISLRTHTHTYGKNKENSITGAL